MFQLNTLQRAIYEALEKEGLPKLTFKMFGKDGEDPRMAVERARTAQRFRRVRQRELRAFARAKNLDIREVSISEFSDWLQRDRDEREHQLQAQLAAVSARITPKADITRPLNEVFGN